MKRALLLAFGLVGCLEGDPNPTTSGTSGSTAINPTGTSGGSVTPSGQCSKQENVNATFTFVNRTQTTVQLFWVNFQCQEQAYGTVGPGADTVQQTFVNHIWRVRDRSTGTLYKEFSVGGASSQVVSLP